MARRRTMSVLHLSNEQTGTRIWLRPQFRSEVENLVVAMMQRTKHIQVEVGGLDILEHVNH